MIEFNGMKKSVPRDQLERAITAAMMNGVPAVRVFDGEKTYWVFNRETMETLVRNRNAKRKQTSLWTQWKLFWQSCRSRTSQ